MYDQAPFHGDGIAAHIASPASPPLNAPASTPAVSAVQIPNPPDSLIDQAYFGAIDVALSTPVIAKPIKMTQDSKTVESRHKGLQVKLSESTVTIQAVVERSGECCRERGSCAGYELTDRGRQSLHGGFPALGQPIGVDSGGDREVRLLPPLRPLQACTIMRTMVVPSSFSQGSSTDNHAGGARMIQTREDLKKGKGNAYLTGRAVRQQAHQLAESERRAELPARPGVIDRGLAAGKALPCLGIVLHLKGSGTTLKGTERH